VGFKGRGKVTVFVTGDYDSNPRGDAQRLSRSFKAAQLKREVEEAMANLGKTLTIELTEEQAEALAASMPRSMPVLNDAWGAVEKALAAHRQTREREGLGLPWEACEYRPCDEDKHAWHIRWFQGGVERFLGGYVHTGITEPQARLMSAAPEMADCLGWILDWTTWFDRPAPNRPKWTDVETEKVRAALKKAGR
jgi:hypothetical protein